MTEPSPESSPVLPQHRSSNPFRASGDYSNINPFADSFTLSHSPTDSLPEANGRPPHDIRHCTSETNLSKLKKEYQPLRSLGEVEPLFTRSEEDLLSSAADGRHCIANTDSHGRVNGEGSQKAVKDPLDYKSRRSRSTNTSPTQLRKSQNQGSIDSEFQTRLEFNLSSSSLEPLASKANMRNPELSNRQHQITSSPSRGRRRGGSRAPPPPPSSSIGTSKSRSSKWVSRYRPGVPIAVSGESARESIMQAELRHREEQFCNPKQLRSVEKLTTDACVYVCVCVSVCLYSTLCVYCDEAGHILQYGSLLCHLVRTCTVQHYYRASSSHVDVCMCVLCISHFS